MPELSKADQEKLNKEFLPRLTGLKCTVCSSSKWSVMTTIFESSEYGKSVFDGKYMVCPVVNVTCGECAFMMSFNAIQLGVVVPNQPEGAVRSSD